MRLQVLALAAALCVASVTPAVAAVTIEFSFPEAGPSGPVDPTQEQDAFTALLPYFPIYNALVPAGDFTCQSNVGGTAIACGGAALLADSRDSFGGSEDVRDVVVYLGPHGGETFYYFDNGALSVPGTYHAQGAKLVVSGSADEIEPVPSADQAFTSSSPGGVPEPSAWALLVSGFWLLGAALRRERRIRPRLSGR